MSWLSSRQARIIESISRKCATYTIAPASFNFLADQSVLRNRDLELTANLDRICKTQLQIIAVALCRDHSVSVSSKNITVDICIPSRTELNASFELARTNTAVLHFSVRPVTKANLNWEPDVWKWTNPKIDDASPLKIDLVFRPFTSVKFSFLKQRRDVGLFGSQEMERPHKARSPAIRPVPRETNENKGNLEDRLRWILTPPLHEVLSDPSLGLPETPYDYQVRGIGWLMGRNSALLADEMGLGKTMQAIIAARILWRDAKIQRLLIVCPKTLLGTWRTEIGKWWPSAGFNICEPAGDTQQFLKLATTNITIKLVNYERLARETDWLVKGDRCGTHDLIIVDEAQRIKNPSSKSAKAVKSLQGDRRWALTGTPLETKIEDVVSIFGFVKPGLLNDGDQAQVRNRIRPHLLRRRVEEVSIDLPDKDDRNVEVELGPSQRDTYDRAEDEGVVALNERGETVTVQHVFVLIQKLMQLCNFDPRTGDSCKLERITEDLEEIAESGRKVLLFSQFVAKPFGLKEIKDKLPQVCRTVELHGEVPQHKRDAAVRALADDPQINTALLHYRVGGVGLNLQAANYVYLFDRWWNPAVEDQAVKRVHRIGQKSKVFIRRLFCKETIEERILQKLAERRRLFAHVIDEERPLESVPLSEEEWFSLFEKLKARPRRVQAKVARPPLRLDDMDYTQFEVLVSQIYQAQGYEVRLTGGSHDGGIDVVAERRSGPGVERIAVQCKHTRSNIGRPDLQKLFGVISADQGFNRGDLVTSSDFSAEGKAFARDKRITLVNRASLVKFATEHGVATFLDP